MSSAAHRETVVRLKEAVEAVLKEVDEFGVSEERTSGVVDIIRAILEDGLEGNRSIKPFVWSVVRRVGQAYPVTFHSSIDKVRALARQDGMDREQVEETWIKQALHEGVLSTMITSIIRQFQIRSAYLSEALICDRQWRIEVVNILDQLKGVIQSVPDAPSVSSWSSDDSFICTPRSPETDNSFDPIASHALSVKSQVGRRSDDGSQSEIAPEEDAGKDVGERFSHVEKKQPSVQNDLSSGNSSLRPAKKTRNRQLSQVQETPGQLVSAFAADTATLEKKRMSSEESLEIKTPERPSLFGLISRTLSGTLSGTLYQALPTEATHKDSPMSELSPEEQTSRFWSRHRTGSGSASSLLREVEKDIGVGMSTPVTAEERATASRVLIKELNKVSRLVLQQYCSNGFPMNVELYPLSKILHLYEEAFAIGLRPRPLFQPTVPNMYLSDFEKITPSGNATPFSVLVGMQTIYPNEPLGTMLAVDAEEDSSKFQQWLKKCLTDSCLGERVETVLNHQDFLQGWYCPQAIITNEDLVQELIATCRGLDAISIEGGCEQKSSNLNKSNHRTETPSGNGRFSLIIRRHKEMLFCAEEMSSKEASQGKCSEGTPAVAPLSPDAVDNKIRMKDDLEENNSEDEWLTTQIEGVQITGRGVANQEIEEESSDKNRSFSCADQERHDLNADDFESNPRRSHPSEDRSSATEHIESALSFYDDIQENAFSSQELPSYQQITLASARSGKLKVGEASRQSSHRHLRTASVVSSCLSGEDEEDWRGVWKDVDVVRHEMRSTASGDHYITYIVEVMASDGTHWQTARRFRDLVGLYKNLSKQEVELPHSWTNLVKARIVTGKKRFTSEIIEARSALIRQCLWDLMTGFPESLIWTSVAEFLDAPLSLLRGTKSRQRTDLYPDEKVRNLIHDRIDNHLNRLALIVDLPVQVTDEVLFEMQKGLCAGCQTYLPCISHQKSLFRSPPAPRKCTYTELLYCHKCHQSDSAFLPSRVLHCWDFVKYPVSVSAKTYLYSIFPSPVLCIDAVNPGLLASVPILAHLEYLRQRIVNHMDQLRSKGSEGRRIALSIEETAGSNKHLIENAEYWSLKDLGDISRGVFARLPRWLEAVNKQIETVVEMHGN